MSAIEEKFLTRHKRYKLEEYNQTYHEDNSFVRIIMFIMMIAMVVFQSFDKTALPEEKEYFAMSIMCGLNLSD